MFAELYVAASGMAVRQEKIDALAHNLANINTVGFKMGEVVLEERPLDTQGGALNAPSQVRLVGRRTDFSQGELQHTGEPLDVALGQAGFFVVESPDGVRLSRDGRFSLDPNGRLVLRNMPVLGSRARSAPTRAALSSIRRVRSSRPAGLWESSGWSMWRIPKAWSRWGMASTQCRRESPCRRSPTSRSFQVTWRCPTRTP
jgi:flagellar hook-basal body protein